MSVVAQAWFYLCVNTSQVFPIVILWTPRKEQSAPRSEVFLACHYLFSVFERVSGYYANAASFIVGIYTAELEGRVLVPSQCPAYASSGLKPLSSLSPSVGNRKATLW